MTNLLVSTTNADERARLDEQFSLRDNYYHLPGKDCSTLEAFIRAVSFHYFQNSPPLLTQKIIAFAENAANRIFCLDLLREIMQAVGSFQDRISLYKKYFAEIGREVGEGDNSHIASAENDHCFNQQNDRVFALADMGEMRLTRHLQSADFQEICDLKPKKNYLVELSQRTQLPDFGSPNPQESPHPDPESQGNLSQIFNSADNYYGSNDWWRQEKHPNDSSKEISRFDCRAGTLFHEKSIGMLVIEELKYDLNREIEIGKDINKHHDMESAKYKKMMKDKLLTAKLKKRKKK